MDAAEVLERAADVMDKLGQCKDQARGPNGSVCILAATFDAIPKEELWDLNIWNIRDAANTAIDRAVGNLVSFNLENNKSTVTSTMRAVAATLRAQSGGTHEATVKQESNAAEPVSV